MAAGGPLRSWGWENAGVPEPERRPYRGYADEADHGGRDDEYGAEEEAEDEERRVEELLEGLPFAVRMLVLQLREENAGLLEQNVALRERGEDLEDELARCRQENHEIHRRGVRRTEQFNGLLSKQAAEAETLKAKNAKLKENSAAAYRVANRAALELHKIRAIDGVVGPTAPAAFRPASPRPGDLVGAGGGPAPTPRPGQRPGTPRGSVGGRSTSSQATRRRTVEEKQLRWLSNDQANMSPGEAKAAGLLTHLERYLVEHNMRLRVAIGGGRTMDAGEFFDALRRLYTSEGASLLEVSGVQSKEELWRLLRLSVPPSESQDKKKERISVAAVDKACAWAGRCLGHIDPCLSERPEVAPLLPHHQSEIQ